MSLAQIHDRMPAILELAGYERWLGLEPDPHDLLITYPSEPMTMGSISTRVNKPEHDDPSLLDRTADPLDVWLPATRPYIAAMTSSNSASTAACPLMSLILISVAVPQCGRARS